MIAETRVVLLSQAGRMAEKFFTPVIPLTPIEGATLENAKEMDSMHGDFVGSANRYYSLITSPDIEIKAGACIGLAQELINLGAFQQARRVLVDFDEAEREITRFPRDRGLYFRARIQEKLGWISDYELDFMGAKRHFESAGGLLLESKPMEEWEDDERMLYSTTCHFAGRAKYYLAAIGVKKSENVTDGIDNFGEAILLDSQIPDQHQYGKLAFGYAWIARCYRLDGYNTLADMNVGEAVKFFDKQVEVTPDRRDFIAHKYMLHGERGLKIGDTIGAQVNFSQALNERKSQTVTYPKGMADAYLGLAAAFCQDGNLLEAAKCFGKAFRIHKYSVLRGVIGG